MGKISIAQADRLAERTYTPLGYLYLSKPPEESLPIRDFRTRGDALPRRPSPNLLDTIYQMQRRQDWMRDDLIEGGADPLEFVGAYSLTDGYMEVAAAMRAALGLADGWAEERSNWSDALRFLRDRLDEVGILVVFNGVVGNNTKRKLDPDEFQGFVLVDEYAPLVFVNSATLSPRRCSPWPRGRPTFSSARRACPFLTGCCPRTWGGAVLQPGRRGVPGAAAGVAGKVLASCSIFGQPLSSSCPEIQGERHRRSASRA